MMLGTLMKDTSEDDGADMYVPFKQDGTFNPFRPKPPEELPETFKSERSFARHTVTAPRIRRLVSVAKGRELLRQKQSVEIGHPLLHGKKAEHHGMSPGGLDGVKTDVDTEAEDSEVSVAEAYDDGRPTVFDTSTKKKEEQDGCGHLFISSKGPLRSPDEPPDFLQLPEPIKQRTAGAARVAAAARAWAAASITTPAPAPGAFSGWQQAGAAAGQPNQDVMLPPTARGMPPPGNAAAAIAAELQRQNNFGNLHDAFAAGPGGNHPSAQAYQAHPGNPQPIAESREVVAGPAVLALRRMRNRMSALAEGRLPWNFSRSSAQSQPAQSSQQAQPVQQIQQAQPAQPGQPQQVQQMQPGQPELQQLPIQPQPPQQPQSGPRRPLLPNLGARSNAAATSSAVPAPGPASAGAASSSGPAAAGSAAASSGDAAGSAAARDEPQMQSVVPGPPSQPKPPSSSGASRFWKRPWPRVNLNLNPFGSSSGASASNSAPAGSSAAASSSQGASSSRQGNEVAGSQSQDATPSSAAARGVGSP